MDTLVEILTLDDLKNKIASAKEYIRNIRKYGSDMKAFLPLFAEDWRLPIKLAKYNGKIAYIDWILRSDELFLCLNVTYFKTGKIKSVESVSQQLALVEIGDLKNVRTLSGKRFKKNYVQDRSIPVYTVIGDRIIAPKPFKIVENGMERFAMRKKIIEKYSLQSAISGV
jgi:hypothetical protein